ncbi:MAG: efflux transporter outer membrane subunit [Betaproteobacteria bacterium]
MRRPDFQRSAFIPKKTALATLLLLSLAGCAVGPDYQRPAAGLPEAFVSVAAADSTPVAEAQEKEWWLLFQDQELNALVTRALAYNFDLQLAVARVEEAEGVMREAGAVFYPEIDLNTGATRNQVSTRNAIPLSSSIPRLQDNRNAALATSFEIDLWGKLRRANQAARADLLSSRYARATVELTVAGLVASNYLNLRAVDANLMLTRSTLESRQKALDIVNRRLEGGNASPIDLYQAEGTLAAAEAQLADLRRQRALAQNQLALLTGQPGMTVVPGDLRLLPLPPLPPAGLPSSLLENRPDIRQAEETLVSANARIGVAKAALFPSLSLTGSMGSSSAALANLFTAGAGTWSLGLAAAMPIFDAGRNFARIDQASARQKQALVSYQKTVQTAFKEVNDALVSLQENGDGERAQQRRVQATGKTLELAQFRYEAGYSAFLEVLDAQRSANDALLSYIAIRQARLNSTVELFKSLGGGWKDDYKAVSLKNSGAEATPAPVVTATGAK